MAVANTTRTLTDVLFEDAAVARCLLAPDGTVLRANAAWLRSTGLSAEQVLGEDFVDLFPAAHDLTLALHARARSGHRVEVPRHALVVNGRETWWETTLEPVPMEAGTGLLITAREVSRREGPADEDARLAAEVLEHGDGVFVLDAEFRVVLANEAFERASGLTREGIRGRSFWDLFPLAAQPESPFSRSYRQAMRERVPVRFEASYPPRGTWNEISVYPTRSGGIAVFFRDVTKRHEAEEALAREEERYRGLFQHSVDAVFLALRDGTILDANPAACRLHGMTLEELRQAGRAGLVVVDARHAAALRQRDATGAVRAELTARRKDGSTVPVEVESVTIDPSRPDSPTFVISRDISARRRTEEELHATLERYERQVRLFDGVTSTTPDFVYVFDREGRFLYANRRLLEVWGMQLQDAIGKTCRELGYEQWHHDMHLREIAQVIATRLPIKGEVPFKAPLTGIFGVYEYIFTPVLGADGEVEIIAGTSRDVTDRKQTEEALVAANEKLREADRRKDEFLAMLAHELRNPLAPIRNSSYILRHAAPSSDKARRSQEVIERQTQHLTRLVDDLLDVTRIARGKIELRRERVDLREVVGRAADDFRFKMDQDGVAFQVVVPDLTLPAEADPTRVAQVVGNLLHNASKFTRRGDEVVVSVAAAEGCGEVRVRDTGAGIDPALLPRVFEAFVQADQSLARTQGGLGLGLALVKGIVELHGGSVRAESAGSGQGAEFIVRIPLATPVAAAARDQGAAPRLASGGRRVLVVDDNRDAAESLAELVRMLGHSAEVAFDGLTAIEHARVHAPDVVLCDIGLPGMSGYDVARALRAQRRAVQLFAVSGYAQQEDVRKAVEAGFDAHVVKPLDIGRLEKLLA